MPSINLDPIHKMKPLGFRSWLDSLAWKRLAKQLRPALVDDRFQLKSRYLDYPIIPERLLYSVIGERFQQRRLLVNKGQQLESGQLIAEAENGNSPLHCALAGQVETIQQRPLLHADYVTALTVEVAVFADRANSYDWLRLTPQQFQIYLQQSRNASIRQQWLKQIQQAGVVGMGGAGFEAIQKIATKSKISTLLINACECEPIISCDDALIQQQSETVIQASLAVAQLINVRRCFLLIEDDKPLAIDRLKKVFKSYQSLITDPFEIRVVPARYPSGHERQLVEFVDGIRLKANQTLLDQGYINFNVATVVAMFEAIVKKRPLLHRIVSVSDGQQIINLPVFIGTPIIDLIKQLKAYGLTEQFDPMIEPTWVVGGPMNGLNIATPEVGVLKTTNCVLCLPTSPLTNHMPCIRCADCVSVCPADLLPQQLYWYAQQEDHQQALNQRLMDCIECGNCAYVCPSQIPLVQYYRRQKKQINQLQIKNEQAETAKQRFQKRNQRLQTERLEHQQKIQQKRQQAKQKLAEYQQNKRQQSNQTNKSAAVAAAQARARARLNQSKPIKD